MNTKKKESVRVHNQSKVASSVKLGMIHEGRLCFKINTPMGATIITTDDLRDFKIELLLDIKKLLAQHSGQVHKKWLKSPEVRELLGISPGTLQTLRINGTLPYTKIGGVLYYEYQDILAVLEANRIHNKY